MTEDVARALKNDSVTSHRALFGFHHDDIQKNIVCQNRPLRVGFRLLNLSCDRPVGVEEMNYIKSRQTELSVEFGDAVIEGVPSHFGQHDLVESYRSPAA